MPMLTVDIHTHILPAELPDLASRYGYGGFISIEQHGSGCARMMRDGRNFRDIEALCECGCGLDTAGSCPSCDAQAVRVAGGGW